MMSDGFLAEAPLRICPLGAHVDHQGGRVTGMTIDRGVVLAAAPTADTLVRVTSLQFSGAVEVDLNRAVSEKHGDWGDYLRAAVFVLGQNFELRRGLRAVIGGDLPGAGLSSSAAVLISYLLGLSRANEIEISREEVSALAQQAENDFVGVDCGRLDQSIILFAEPERLTCVDCSDLTIGQVARPEGAKDDFRVLVADSGVDRRLAGSGFNDRVEECREAARLLLAMDDQASSGNGVLSDVSPEVFKRYRAELPRVARLRATHYFSEQDRVNRGVDAWRRGDLSRFGKLMNASGASSIQNYESGTSELATLSDLLRNADGVYGARFSGGGFGGSCIALIEPGADRPIIEEVSKAYHAAHPEAAAGASFHVCRTGGPALIRRLEQ